MNDNLSNIPVTYLFPLKNTAFVFSLTNKDARSRFLCLIFMKSLEIKIYSLIYGHYKHILSLNRDWY